MALFVLAMWDETSPYKLTSIVGPSMLPTLAPDGSDIWVRRTYSWSRNAFGRYDHYRAGDLVGVSYPDDVSRRVSCKRVVGVAGDTVRRYGEYVHLYLEQDPDRWGIVWPDSATNDSRYGWLTDRKWDDDDARRRMEGFDNHAVAPEAEAARTLVVPPGHVWVEGDCPALSIDSRHYGPVPVEWIKGKLVARIWPLWKTVDMVADPGIDGATNRRRSCYEADYRVRPHPIPLDEHSLRRHNVHKVITTPKTERSAEEP